MHGDGWGGWIAGAVMMIAFWGSLVLLIVIAVRLVDVRRSGDRGDGIRPRDGAAHEILAERFARGEISAEEFEGRRRVLEGNAS